MASSRNALKEMHTRIAARLQTLFGGPESQGYEQVPGNTGITSYGTVPGTSAAANNGLQVLPADASKIEPKVWLASERTFLNWLRVAFLISSFALALANSAGEHDRVARWMGLSYAVIAVGIIGYAWAMHTRRRSRIIHRYAGHHDELYGPVIVVALIFLAVLVNFILRVNQRERLRHVPSPKNPWLMTVDLVRTALTWDDNSDLSQLSGQRA